MSDWQDTTTPTARKEHQCEVRGCVIKPGEKYEKTAVVQDGDFSCIKMCLRHRDSWLNWITKQEEKCFHPDDWGYEWEEWMDSLVKEESSGDE